MGFLKLSNKLRREFMKAANKDYIKNKLSNRAGECKKCGKCCRGCKFLDEESGLCKVYDERPNFCHKDFPIDSFDQKVFGIENCGYSFRD